MAYVTNKQKQEIIKYSNELLDVLAKSFRYSDSNSDLFIYYQRRYYYLKQLFHMYIHSL